MTDWMTEEYGIPHKDGKVRWYVIGFQEDMFEYLGWFDMTDWDGGFEYVLMSARLLKFVVDADEDDDEDEENEFITNNYEISDNIYSKKSLTDFDDDED